MRVLFFFFMHMLATAAEGKGRVGVVVPHGVLFRGAAEGIIRKAVIEENLLAGVIGLPANLFYGAGIPAALLIFDKARTAGGKDDVFFIDASREFDQGTNQNVLRKDDMDKIVGTYHNRTVHEKYSYSATFKEIKENDFNLNIPRYVDTFEPEPEVDIPAVQEKIRGLEGQLAETRARMNGYLEELGF